MAKSDLTETATKASAKKTYGRGERRRLETRRKLLGAGLKLMAENGMEGVAINEITEAADVGFGSFYNHFESKEALYDTLVDEVVVGFASALDTMGNTIQDPAEILSASVRYGMLRAQANPLWGRFLLRASTTPAGFQRGVGPRLLRDLMRGITEGSFNWSDKLTALLTIGGTGLAAIGLSTAMGDKPELVGGLITAMGLEQDDLPTRVAATMLKVLGLDEAEALEVAQRPLPEVDLPDQEWFKAG